MIFFSSFPFLEYKIHCIHFSSTLQHIIIIPLQISKMLLPAFLHFSSIPNHFITFILNCIHSAGGLALYTHFLNNLLFFSQSLYFSFASLKLNCPCSFPFSFFYNLARIFLSKLFNIFLLSSVLEAIILLYTFVPSTASFTSLFH